MATDGCVIYSRNYTNAQVNTDAGNPYVAADYYTYSLTEVDEELERGGRLVGPPRCHGTGDFEHTGVYRALILLLQTLLVPICAVLGVKLLAIIIRGMPGLRQVRSRNRALRRTAILRKAEVRRMSEGGQKYIVKRLASQAVAQGQHLGSSKNAFLALAYAQVEAKRRESRPSLREPSMREPLPGHQAGGASLSRRSEPEAPTAHEGPLAPRIEADVRLRPIAPAATGTAAAKLRAKLTEVKGRLPTGSTSEKHGSQHRSHGSVNSSFNTPKEPLPATTRPSETTSPPRRARIDPSAAGELRRSPEPDLRVPDTSAAGCRQP